MQVLQPLSWHTVPHVAVIGGGGRPEGYLPVATACQAWNPLQRVLSKRTRRQRRRRGKRDSHSRRSQPAASLHHKYRFTDDFPESRLYQEVLDGTYIEEPEIERLVEMRTLIDRLNIRVNLLGHHVSNTIPVTGALPDDKTAILRELDTAITRFPENELKAYRNSICHL